MSNVSTELENYNIAIFGNSVNDFGVKCEKSQDALVTRVESSYFVLIPNLKFRSCIYSSGYFRHRKGASLKPFILNEITWSF